jgi:hypothetical protein
VVPVKSSEFAGLSAFDSRRIFLALQTSALHRILPVTQSGAVAQPHSDHPPHGRYGRRVLGRFALSGTEAIPRRQPSESDGRPQFWNLDRVWRTTVNGLDANRIGMTFSFLFSLFSFLFGPAALTFLATLQRRRTKSRYRNTLLGTLAVTGLVEIGDSAISDSGFRPRRGPA